MERLWAPWRMEFILSEKGGECIFCLAREEADDEKGYVLYRGRHNFILLNRYPYNNGHLMIVPYDHVSQILDMSKEARTEMMTLTGISVDIFKEALSADGVNCGINLGRSAGAGIEDHIHLHVVPRWTGDSNFLPVIADTRSMPEYISDTYRRLKPYFERIGKTG